MLKLTVFAIAVAVVSVLAPGAAEAEGPVIMTILEGTATVIHGTSKLGAIEGVRVQPNDLIETATDTFARIEFDQGNVRLDLGPGTRLQVNHPTETSSDRPALYLLSGWIKLSLSEAKRPRAPAFGTLLFDGTDLDGVVLARVDPRGGAVFIEQGRARLANRHGKPFALAPLKSNDFVTISKDGHTAAEPHVPKEFVDQMPRAFRDTIPSRWARYRDREIAAKALGDFSYAEVEPWINAEQSVRRQFVQAWRPRADDPAFRLELTAKLSLHPEWAPVLFPQLYGPKAAEAASIGPPWPLPATGPIPH
jgi:hypothetical protein